MRFCNPYWTDKIRIELLQKWILIHSAIYYELNNNLVPDSMFDENCIQLRAMMCKCKEEASKSKWAKAFKEYEHSETTSGFDLLRKLKKYQMRAIIEEAKYLVRCFAK